MAKRKQPQQPDAAPPLRLEWRSPAELAVNPKNWRTHPEAQQAALQGVLSEVGWAGACLYNETTGLLIDGHLRQKVAMANGADKIPVLIGRWTPEQEAKILATIDPIAGMAGADPVKLDALLREVDTGCAELQQMLADLWEDNRQADGSESGEGEPDTTYTNKIIAPVYEPKGEKPPLTALIDRTKTLDLIACIDAADVPDDVKDFLRLAAERHTVFNFRQIAEFYCHADAALQDLMERSGLVIIDFHKAIEYGFVHLTERLGQLADLEEADNGNA